jgi:hypothetical protein
MPAVVCPRCARSFANAGNFSQHQRRCFVAVGHHRPTRARMPASVVVPDPNALPHKWQRVLRKQQLEREVCHFADICQTSTRHRQSQNGKPFAPFDGFSDTIWQQRLIEDSIGKPEARSSVPRRCVYKHDKPSLNRHLADVMQMSRYLDKRLPDTWQTSIPSFATLIAPRNMQKALRLLPAQCVFCLHKHTARGKRHECSSPSADSGTIGNFLEPAAGGQTRHHGQHLGHADIW